MKTDYFRDALDYMEEHKLSIYPTRLFQEYIKEYNFSPIRTQEVISIDNINELGSVSKKAIEVNAMPLRLGSPKGSNTTAFTLVKVANKLSDFFLYESEMFVNREETFIPTSSLRNLFPFELIPTFTENTLINLALESGLMHEALKLDPMTEISAVVIGYSSRFEFEFRPHSFIDCKLHHYPGQVEIDAVFLGKRNGREHLFVIEAKNSFANTLAKHKLFYPTLALLSSKRIPFDIKIVPVYLKTMKTQLGWNFNTIECEFPKTETDLPCLDLLMPIKNSHMSLTLPIFNNKDGS